MAGFEIKGRLEAGCRQSGLAAQCRPPPEPAIPQPLKRLIATPLAAATQQQLAARGAEHLLAADATGSSRPWPSETSRSDLSSRSLVANSPPAGFQPRALPQAPIIHLTLDLVLAIGRAHGIVRMKNLG
jgi:hypothetical protein